MTKIKWRFWNLFSTNGLSQICKIRNVWKLPSPLSKNTLISCSEKTSWSLKTSIWKKNCQINSKTVMKNSSYVRTPCKFLNFMVLGARSPKTLTPEKFTWPFFNLLNNFSSKTTISYFIDLIQTRGAKKLLKQV
jgi:hypothetical protein